MVNFTSTPGHALRYFGVQVCCLGSFYLFLGFNFSVFPCWAKHDVLGLYPLGIINILRLSSFLVTFPCYTQLHSVYLITTSVLSFDIDYCSAR